MKFSFSIAILFSLAVVASGLGLAAVQAQSPPPIELSEYVSYCDDMPRETLEEKIEKRECRVEEAQRGVDEADPSKVPWWQEQLEIRQAGLDRLLAKQLEAAGSTESATPEPTPEATPEPTPEATPEPEPTMSQDDDSVIEALTMQLGLLTNQMELLAMQLEELSNQMEASESANQVKASESASADFPMLDLSYKGFGSSKFGFALGIPYSDLHGITMLDDQLYIVDRSYRTVFVYNIDGTMDSSSDFKLDVDNRDPHGITAHDGKLWVVGYDKVYVYNTDGTRDTVSDFDLDADNRTSGGITALNNKFWVVDGYDDKVYVYNTDGTRDTVSDFDLGDNNYPYGITAHDGKLVSIARNGNVYVYNQDGSSVLSHNFAESFSSSDTHGMTIHDDKIYSLIAISRNHNGGTAAVHIR